MSQRFMRYLILFVLLVGCSPDPEPEPNNNDNVLDPKGFEFEPTLEDAPWLLHVNGRSATDLWVVGGEPTRGEVYQKTDEDFAAVEIPEVPLLNWIHLFEDSEIVVGNGGTILRRQNDGAFEIMTTPTEEDLWGVWGASPDDIWAVGGRGREAGQATILRYDGVEWLAVPFEIERPNVNAFFKVWGSGPDDVYIVGQRGVLLNWTGDAFEELGVGTGEDLISVHGVSRDHVAIVGGRGNGIIAVKEDSQWTLTEIAPRPGLNGVFMTDPETVWVAGNRGLIGRFRNGTLAEPEPATARDFHAIYLDNSGLTAVGGTFSNTAGPYVGVAMTHQGFTP